VSEEFKKREKTLNILFMTPGVLSFSGRDGML